MCLDCGAEHDPRAKRPHRCGYGKCPTCKVYAPENHECYMQPFKFNYEEAFKKAGEDHELLEKAEALYDQHKRKSRYIVWDIETFALNQETGKGQQVPHFIAAATTCHRCLDEAFRKQTCEDCGGYHKTNMCLSAEEWRLDNDHTKTSCWAQGEPCDECGQQLAVFRAGKSNDF